LKEPPIQKSGEEKRNLRELVIGRQISNSCLIWKSEKVSSPENTKKKKKGPGGRPCKPRKSHDLKRIFSYPQNKVPKCPMLKERTSLRRASSIVHEPTGAPSMEKGGLNRVTKKRDPVKEGMPVAPPGRGKLSKKDSGT